MACYAWSRSLQMHEIDNGSSAPSGWSWWGRSARLSVHDLRVLLPITLAAEMYAPDKPEEELRRLYAAS